MQNNEENEREDLSTRRTYLFKIIVAVLFTVVSIWVLDSIIDYLYFSNNSFLNILFIPPTHEIFSRSVNATCFIIFGLLILKISHNRNQLRKRAEHLNHILFAIRNVNQLITKENDKVKLLENICNSFTETNGFYNAWIVLLKDDAPVEPFYHSGFNGEFNPMAEQLRECRIPSCAQKALVTGQLQVIDNPEADCLECPFTKICNKRCGLSIRLEHESKVYGWITASINAEFAHDEEIQDLFAEVSRDISYAFWNIEEKERRRSTELKYNSILTSTIDGVIATDLEGNIIVFNYGAEKFFQCKAQDVIGKSIAQFCPEDRRHEQAQVLQELLSTGNSKLFETERNTLTGFVFPVEITLNINLDAQNEPTGFSGVIRDITERNKIETKLRESEEKYRSLYLYAPLSYQSVDVNGNFLDINPKWLQTLGYERDEVIGKNFSEFLHPDSTPNFHNNFAAFKECGCVENAEFKMRHKDGHYIYVSLVGQIGYWPDGSFRQTYCVFQDITETKLIKKVLRENEERFRTYFELGLIGMAITSVEKGWIECNDELCNLFGYSRDELFKLHWDKITHPDDLAIDLNFFQRVIDGELDGELDGYKLDKRFIRKNGEIVYTELSVKALRNADSSVQYFVVLINDITKQKQQEQILSARVRLSEQSFATTSNELLKKFLEEAENLTESQIGFFHFVDEDQKTIQLQEWSSRTTDLFCKVKLMETHYPISKAGVWVDCVHEKKPVIHNDYASLPHKKGMPEGHAVLVRELTVPVVRGDKVVAILGVGNKPQDYDENDVNAAQQLADQVWEIVERQRTKVELQESVLKQTEAVKAANVGLWNWNLLDNTVDYSPEWKRMIGYEDHEISASADEFISHLHPDDRERVKQKVEKSIAAINKNHQVEFRFRHKNGSYCFILCQASVYADEFGQAVSMRGSHIDITRIKAAENLIRQSEEHYRHLFKTMAQGVVYFNQNAEIISINPAAQKILGFPAEQLIGAKAQNMQWKALHEDGTDFLPDQFPSVVALTSGKEVEDVMGIFNPSDNDYWWLNLHAKPIFETNSTKPSQVFVTFEDITQLKKSKIAQVESENKYSLLFNEMLEGFALHEIVCDESGKPVDYIFIDLNTAFERMTNLNAADVVGKSVKEIMPDTEPFWIETYGRVALTGEPTQFEHYSSELNRHFEVSAFRPKPNHFACIFIDVTDKKILDHTIHKLVDVSSSNYGNMLFEMISLELANNLGADQVIIGEIDSEDKNYIQTRAFVVNGLIAENIKYCLDHTPCENVIQTETCIYESGVSELFPNDAYLKDHAIEGYAGVPLFNAESTPVGVLAVLFHKPIAKTDFVKSILHLFSVRVAAELERLQIDISLYQHMAQYQSMLESSLDGFWVSDREGKILEANQAYIDMTGYNKDELMAMNINETDANESVEDVTQHIDKIIQSGYDRFESQHRCKDGHLIDLEISTTYLPQFGGRFYTFLRDVTPRKQAENDLRKSEKIYRQLIETASDAIYLISDTGKIILSNAAASQLLGRSNEEIETLTIYEIDPNFTVDEFLIFWNSLKDDEPQSFESTHIRKDGTVFPVAVNGAKFRVNHNLYFYGIARDITNEQMLEEQIRQSQKMESIGNLAGGIAHDFNNMLSVILGHCELLKMDETISDDTKKHATEIQNASNRSADLTSQLLAFARKQTVQPVSLNLNEIVKTDSSMITRLIGENIKLALHLTPDIWPIYIDPSQIDQILFNLSVNARDAISGQGKITIETANRSLDDEFLGEYSGRASGDYVVLSLQDNGSGMTDEVHSKLFEPFFTTKPEGMGTGLGLATVFGVTKQNDGHIKVTSSEGVGTTFDIYFPRSSAPARQVPTIQNKQVVSSGREVVLLVEDDESLMIVNHDILKLLGYTVLSATSPNEALNIARQHINEIQLLLTDVIMPEMNGRKLWEEISIICPNAQCLFISGYTDDVIAQHGVLEEGINFISKPITIETLSAKLREVLK